MIDSIYQDSIDTSLDDQLQRPRPAAPAAAPFTFSGFGKAATVSAVGGGVAQSIASASDIVGAFGQVLAATDGNSGGMFSQPTPAERTQREQANLKLQTEGVDYSSTGGDLFRQRAEELMPDPATSHASEQIVAGVGKSLVKAVGHAAMFGPAAPLTFGLDEGLTESDRLKQQGVDLTTRTKVGAVTGAVAGASLVVPMAAPGQALKTVGYVAASGPGGFVAQNAANRAILQHAGYDKLSDQYDPLDPVGIALSTLLPAVFGYAGFRGAKPAAPSPKLRDIAMGLESGGHDLDANGQVLTSPKGAKGKMQVMDATNRDPGFGVRPAADDSLAERARVGGDYLDAMFSRYGSEDKALAAYNAGPGAMDSALAAAAKKGGDWLAELPTETQNYVRKGMAKLGQNRAESSVRGAVAGDSDVVMAARVNQVKEAVDAMRLTADDDLAGMNAHVDALQLAHDQIARGEDVNVLDRLPLDSLATSRSVEALGSMVRERADPQVMPEAMQAMQDAPSQLVRSAESAPAAELANPDRPVMLDGMDEPMPKSQLLDQVRREADLEAQDAQLYQVAAECFLRQA